MKITVCIGSSCHLKGSRQVVERLNEIIEKRGLQGEIDLVGTFCMGNCKSGVCVTIDEEFFSVTPESVTKFFDEFVAPKLK